MTCQTSVSANQHGINWDGLQWERRYHPSRAYSQSKIALGLFAVELDRRSAHHDWGITSNLPRPGVAPTSLLAARPEMGRERDTALIRLIRMPGRDPVRHPRDQALIDLIRSLYPGILTEEGESAKGGRGSRRRAARRRSGRGRGGTGRMNSEQFVEAINASVCHPAINGVLATIASPPGRRPRRDLAELSSWYNELDDDGKNQVRVLVRRAVHQAIFDMMVVLDGGKAIDDEHTDLYLRTGDGTLINDPAVNELHALFQVTVDHVDESGNPVRDF